MRTTGATGAVAERGFTLLEIMVVVVIIGLLAAIVVPNFMGQVDTAAINRAKQDIRGIETALNLYRLDNFRYPTTDELHVLPIDAGLGHGFDVFPIYPCLG